MEVTTPIQNWVKIQEWVKIQMALSIKKAFDLNIGMFKVTSYSWMQDVILTYIRRSEDVLENEAGNENSCDFLSLSSYIKYKVFVIVK